MTINPLRTKYFSFSDMAFFNLDHSGVTCARVCLWSLWIYKLSNQPIWKCSITFHTGDARLWWFAGCDSEFAWTLWAVHAFTQSIWLYNLNTFKPHQPRSILNSVWKYMHTRKFILYINYLKKWQLVITGNMCIIVILAITW